jgi:glycerophosphoryl diester phosphodiesterase
VTTNFLRIGHRGAAAYATENTLSSIQTALSCNVDMVEMDVRRTKDGTLVLAHDPHLSAEGRRLKIRRHTLAQIQHLCLPGGELVATLEQALAFVKGKALVNIDIKEPGFEAELVQLIGKLDMTTQVMCSSLSAKSLTKIKSINPDIYVALSYPSSFFISLYHIRFLQPLLNYLATKHIAMSPIHFVVRQALPMRAKRLKAATGIDAVMIRAPFISPKLVDIIHRKELKLYAWPADKEHEVEKLRLWGVDGVESNRPDILHPSNKSQHLAAR